MQIKYLDHFFDQKSKEIMKYLKKILRKFGLEIKRTVGQVSLESHLKSVLDKNQIDLVINVGANIGQYGDWLRFMGYKGDILSFEPLPSAFKLLSEKSNKDKRWRSANIGLGDSKEVKYINEYENSSFSSILTVNDFASNRFSGLINSAKVAISVDTLDNYLKKTPDYRNRRIFLKMDTQGYDLNVFRGAKCTLDACRAIQTELSFIDLYDGMPSYREVLHEFEADGYGVSGIFAISRNIDLQIIEADCVLIRSTTAA